MNLNTAIEILECHQGWRIGKPTIMKYNPSELTQAIDIVLAEVKKSVLTNNK